MWMKQKILMSKNVKLKLQQEDTIVLKLNSHFASGFQLLRRKDRLSLLLVLSFWVIQIHIGIL